MGQSHSAPESKEVPIDELSHELSLRFATKCYTHLEIAHYKDNFKTLADHQDDVEYWKEETLCRFLGVPDAVKAGPVIHQMSTYLGAFPFPSLAPCILTREATLKVITILTGRYKKVLKRGNQDRNKLLFRSLAVFDRRMSSALSPTAIERSEQGGKGESSERTEVPLEPRSHATGFTIDEPINDEEEEDDDDLALAALDALDAIEVFKQDQKKDQKIHRAHIPLDNFRNLVQLLLLLGPLTPQDPLGEYGEGLKDPARKLLEESADAIITAFDPDHETEGIRYSNFVKTISTTTPQLFRPLYALFEHFLFSKQLDLNKYAAGTGPTAGGTQTKRSPIYSTAGDSNDTLLNNVLLSQMATSFEIGSTTSDSASSFFHCGARLNLLYSTSSHGTSLSSFSRQMLSWQSASLMVVSGTYGDDEESIVIGAYLPDRWKDATTSNHAEQEGHSTAVMFQLKPRHSIFRANPFNRSTPISYFSSKTGIALGCVIPAQSKLQAHTQKPILGPVGLVIDQDISTAMFQHDPEAGTGAFLTDPRLEESQRGGSKASSTSKKIVFDIDTMEIWGVSFPDENGEDEISKQRKRLAWEEAEAARRRGVNFGGDKDGARHLLEMAGIVGDKAGNRSGGSV